MLTPTPPRDRIVPADIYRRASVREFFALVEDQLPHLDMPDDTALALAYWLAHYEEQGAAIGAAARLLAVSHGFTPDDYAGLLAAGYATVFPMLAPTVETTANE
jgi:hypothetical protein